MASAAPRIPVSQLLGDQTNEEEPKKKSREDWRRAKELEEARKAGTAPAAVDEEGRDINPHIPQYIASAPWYFGSAGPTLKHQRPQEEKQKEFSGLDEWYKRGVDTTKIATKYRKGACENCGALTHKKRDCMDRPRKITAKYSGAKIAADEYIQPNLNLDYDGKRDRWSGYDPQNHREIIEEYMKVEDAKRQLKAEKLKDNPDASLSEDDEDEDKYVDEVDMPGTKVDSKQRITVRNLRIREDTAKYLRNLDPNSAYYDPKTRSMRDNPNPKTQSDEAEFAGENFVRFSGDTQKHAKAQLFAWEAYGKGVDVHLLAEPTKLELLQHEYDKKKEQFKSQVKDTILDRYGGEEHLEAPPKSLLLAQSENYVEYSRSGKLIKGQEKQIIKSRYEEDVYINNHTSVWGSFYHSGEWGYSCCHSKIKQSYCVGENGKITNQETKTTEVVDRFNQHGPSSDEEIETEKEKTIENKMEKQPEKGLEKIIERESESDSSNSSNMEEEATQLKSEKKHKKQKKSKKKKQKEKRKEKRKEKKKSKHNKEEDKLKEALEAEDKHNERVAMMMKMDERKRPYNSMFEVKQPTEEELEAFMIKRRREEDPMLSYL